MKARTLIGIILLAVAISLTILCLVFFQLSRSSKSEKITISPVPEELSVVIEPSPEAKSVRLLFGGDLMFDRHIRKHMTEKGPQFILGTLVPLFAQYDGVIANLEGPITTYPSKSLGSAVGSTNNFLFTFDPLVATLLKESHFTVVNLGNNHIRNFESDGVIQTKQYLDLAGVAYFGDSAMETTSQERTTIQTYGDVTIGFVNYNQFVYQGYEHALEDIAYLRPQVQLLVVYTHWGIEYMPEANQVIQNQAHTFVDAGADAVIGSHPHVTQQFEDYNGKRIYYSLGNFVFDQYFSPEVQKGLLVEMEIAPDKSLRYKEIPIKLLPDGQTVLE